MNAVYLIYINSNSNSISNMLYFTRYQTDAYVSSRNYNNKLYICNTHL